MVGFLTISATPSEQSRAHRSQISLEDFGRIASADIEIAPLTILVGKNNSGKSYLASLLWALHNFSSEISFGRGTEAIKAPKWFREGLKECRNSRSNAPFIVTGAQVSRSLNYWAKNSKNEIVSRVMSLEEATIERLSFKIDGELYIRFKKKAPVPFGTLDSDIEKCNWALSFDKEGIKKKDEEKHFFATSASSQKEADDELFKYVINSLLHADCTPSSGSATYIPAARSGLVLSLEFIASSLFQELGISKDEQYNSRFSRPVISFLRSLVQRPNSRSIASARQQDVVRFLESNILNGSVVREDGSFPSFFYRPKNSKKMLPMHAVSSMVTEMTPVIDRLRSRSHGAIIFEEPEAHLHLEAQRQMARAIVRMVNGGIPVVLTTHSDTFLQEINFLIQMSSAKNRKELWNRFGYGEDDIISIDNILVYEFREVDEKTVVGKAESGPSGFIIESLNDVLLEISDQAYAIEDD